MRPEEEEEAEEEAEEEEEEEEARPLFKFRIAREYHLKGLRAENLLDPVACQPTAVLAKNEKRVFAFLRGRASFSRIK